MLRYNGSSVSFDSKFWLIEKSNFSTRARRFLTHSSIKKVIKQLIKNNFVDLKDKIFKILAWNYAFLNMALKLNEKEIDKFNYETKGFYLSIKMNSDIF